MDVTTFFHGNFSIESVETTEDEDNNNDSNDNETMILIICIGMAFVTWWALKSNNNTYLIRCDIFWIICVIIWILYRVVSNDCLLLWTSPECLIKCKQVFSVPLWILLIFVNVVSRGQKKPWSLWHKLTKSIITLSVLLIYSRDRMNENVVDFKYIIFTAWIIFPFNRLKWNSKCYFICVR